MIRKIKIVLIFVFLINTLFSQVYTEKQTRHRFAQLNLGFDIETSFGGNTRYFDRQRDIKTLDLNSNTVPRFIVGGTHFWGHADFYLAIPLLYPSQELENQRLQFLRGVETVFKYYPWRIEHNKLRPFLGVSIAPFFYEQRNNNVEFGNGPELNNTLFPLLGGITFNSKQHLLELGVAWNYSNQKNYYISRNEIATINTPPIYATLSYRFMLETTIGVEKDWESGRTNEITNKLAGQRKLNGFYLGVGLSSAFWLGQSSYNEQKRPFIEDYGISLMPDFSLGYYLHKLDMNFALGYRSYKTTTNSYGTFQSAKRNSVVFEATKFLFDYHGFVPFIGPAISLEKLNFQENFERQRTFDVDTNKIGYGITFGWDIRPNRIQTWILRTNLRWYPNLKLKVESNNNISFDNIEFNFIQLIIYPNRILKKKPNR